MWSGLPKLVFVTVLVANCVLWSQSRYGGVHPAPSAVGRLSKRDLSRRDYRDASGLSLAESVEEFTRSDWGHMDYTNTTYANAEEESCHPISVPIEQQCAHVLEFCSGTRTFLSIPYLEPYFCAKPPVRPLVFVGYLLWLVFLFSTLGISASDFFCPNLGTLAQLLGMDDNLAGVTLLAFGNGSPDVFATFSAMRANSGGLAIGELLGAASFIVSCVVGSMCIIKPFHVNRLPFIRDVGFFTVAVVLLLAVLWDSKLEAWEAIALVALYFVYVLIVVVGTWWENRLEKKRRYEVLVRDEFREEEVPVVAYHDEEPFRDSPHLEPESSSTLQLPSLPRTRALSSPTPSRLGVHTALPIRSRTRTPSPQSSPYISHMPSFSLVGALEFRRIVSSLQQEAAGSSLSVFESPISPYPGGHYHRHSYSHSHSRSRPRTPLSEEHEPWDSTPGVPLNDRSPTVVSPALAEESHDDTALDRPPIPVISHTPASPISDTDTESQQYVAPTRRERIASVLRRAFHIVFPTLHNFMSKHFLGKVTAVLAAPAVMVLTLTLPVIVTAYEDASSSKEKIMGNENRLVDFEEEGVERALIAEEEVSEEMRELQFNKYLMAVQCVLGPLFCVSILFDGVQHELWLLLATGVAGVAIGFMVAVFADKGAHPTAQMARCLMGFIISVVWIMAIADEVVEVLQAFGFIFGLSDAIIGLTIFAVGNSLADLVANMSVAVFAPIMGFSACFGGPMLNILLGVGISGSYIIRQTAEPYKLHFSTTLVITGAGLLGILLATMIFVPWNGYFLPRSWGVALITAYMCLMIANVIVEVKG
ncbi:hypothetical protein SCP_1202600 [Sparassis crispa]|uniref:Sodium/calcium exchanger membrane region domain-containing protein n=1 Tax=Sparassis crispa TaxID=139825 RepID=A0A401H0V1_9APHY|nr:hypothetical protein SCP_1202600 [Sparassis crispa]GBE88032.1 hypothetical protein SCP_1202600 [Sparassis crispa]